MTRIQKVKGTIIFLILLSFSVCLYLYRLKWGMADVDESFYLSIPFRLLQGDALLADEWNLSQLSAVLQYPLLAIYLKIFKSTEGIIVAFRLLYVIFQTLVSVFTYVVLREKNEIAAVIISILFFLFTPFNIMALSYNTMGLMSVWIVSVLLYSYKKESIIPNIVSGIFFSFVVLCNPFMALAYIVYTIYIACEFLLCKRKDSLKRWFYITIGVGIVFIIFIMFVLSRASIKEILENLTMVLTSPAHGSKSTFEILLPFISFCREFKWYTISVTGLFLLGVFKKKWKNSCFYLSAVVSMALVLKFALTLTNFQGYATIMIPLTPLGAIAFCYSEEKEWKLLFWWIIGVIYAFFMNMASNNGIYVIANGCTVSSLASILMILQYLRGRQKDRVSATIFVIIVIIQLFSQVYVCVNHVFWEEGPNALVSEIQNGPLKGIMTTREKADTYHITYEHLNYIKQNYEIGGKYGLLFKNNPWGYFVLDQMRMGAYSAWMSDIAETVDDERVQKYYEYHSEKFPEMIYVDAKAAKVWNNKQWKEYATDNRYEVIILVGGAYLMIK